MSLLSPIGCDSDTSAGGVPALDVIVCEIDFSLWSDNHLFIGLAVMFFLITHTVTACIIINTPCIIINTACIIIVYDNF